MLIDDITISLKAGDGGNGLSHLRRNAMTAKGGPDGGNGGKGGDIYAIGINDITALSVFRFKKNIIAENGGKGKTEYNRGKNGEDVYIKLPIGTKITDLQTQNYWEIKNDKDKILLAKGSLGGRGNSEFRSAINQTPVFSEIGKLGEEKKIQLELKLIADIGFIGLPNTGKSSLLKEITNANPKIGNYNFTTLEPNLGVFDNLIIADIPGIIEGAANGKGLGIKFLKHIEKTKKIIHFIDVQSENLKKDYEIVRGELEKFSNLLTKKEEIILLTKTDLVDEKKLKTLKLIFKNKKILTVSIYDKTTLEKFKKEIKKQQIYN